MKTFTFYFIAVCIASISCKPINHNIDMKEVYQYSGLSSFKLKTLTRLNTMLQKMDQIFYINTDTT